MIDGFIVEHWLNRKPIEDSYVFDAEKGIMIVADGITRDPKGMPELCYGSRNPWKWYRFFKNYPNPSPAKKAADLFCRTAMEYMRSCMERGELAVRNAFDAGNEALHSFNRKENPAPDYLENDFYGCVAAIASIQNGMISWGNIADSRVCIFDKDGNTPVAQGNKELNEKSKISPNEGPSGELDDMLKLEYKTKFNLPVGRVIIRRHYRNNPTEELAYGALTGESVAMYYVKTGQWELNPEERVVVYTDGLEKIIHGDDFKEQVKQKDTLKLKKVCQKKVETEGTAVVYFPDLREVA